VQCSILSRQVKQTLEVRIFLLNPHAKALM